jgi:hypothetical protein
MVTDRLAWGTAEDRKRDAERLRRDLARALRAYECRFELSSDRLESELAAGRLRETADVSEWVVTLRAFRALTSGRSTQLD